MLRVAIAAALSVLVVSPVAAEPARSAENSAVPTAAREQAPGARSLYICEATDLTRRSFTREYGAITFVKADEATAKGAAWDAPRCISKVEYQRLRQILARNDR